MKWRNQRQLDKQKLLRPSGTTLAQCNAKRAVQTVHSFLAALAGVLLSAFTGLWSAQSEGRELYHLLTKYSVGAHSEMRIHRE